MTTPINPRPSEHSTDPDLAEQAKPGHGVPSQDPDPAAQVRLSPEDAERESGSVLMGGGLVAGAAAGAAVGAAIAGPAGVVVGGVVGSVAGALGGAAAGSAAVDSDPSSEAVKKQP
ncbi:bacteriocin [Acidovorax sp. CCYZU-2555]|uniref:bacteriocin n=1 Tax=Acidovorax sp. CCYZU-2555 TaxID=2835042 RepID=UPI001BCB2511|nr:bacteriocin [Acidovorax sp. CCYZU-2555]MBS7778459.1 bacteriocin [Acidovorax sp. CCYZU-2555]